MISFSPAEHLDLLNSIPEITTKHTVFMLNKKTGGSARLGNSIFLRDICQNLQLSNAE
jgi:hypothetical protein